MGLERGDRVGPYQIGRPLGSGGNGQVFTATDDAGGETVAIKVLRPDAAQDPQNVRRFVQEGEVLAGLRHPRIVKVYASEKLDGLAYMVMEYLKGRPLHEWMERQGGRVELSAVLAVGWQIADAMVEAHAREVIHRDLKPGNVILVSPDTDAGSAPDIKVVDFGSAKVPPASGEHLETDIETSETANMGTPPYIAPELWGKAREATPKADVYSLGVMLYEMLAGRRPFEASEIHEQMRMHVEDAPPPLSDLGIEAPLRLIVLVRAMLAKKPEERPTMAYCRSRLDQLRNDPRDECPFPGLQAFTEEETELFFGREAEIRDVLDRLEQARDGKHRWVQIWGPSGTGKSSLVQAGVLPRLKEKGTGGSPWKVASMRPSNDPIQGLAHALYSALSGSGVEQDLKQIEGALRDGDPGALQELASQMPPGLNLLLVIEQMEELFTLGDKKAVSRFEALLASALSDPESPMRLLTTVRVDLLSRVDQTPTLARLLNKASWVHLMHMDEEALKQVVLGMARLAELALPEGLPARMVTDARGAKCPLPLLGYVLRALSLPEEGAPRDLEQRYEEMGGVGKALAKHAEQLLESLGEKGQEIAKWILLDLVHVDHGVPDTRRTRTREEVLRAAENDPLAEGILLRLSGTLSSDSVSEFEVLRIVVLDGPAEDPSQQRVELIHEALLEAVPRLKQWVDEERSFLKRCEDLETAAKVWVLGSRPEGGLWTGAMLKPYSAELGVERERKMLMRKVSKDAREFLEESERLEQRRVVRRRTIITALLSTTVAAIIGAITAWSQKQNAEENARQAQENAKQAQDNLDELLKAAEKISEIDWKLSRVPDILLRRVDLLTGIDNALKLVSKQGRKSAELSVRLIKIKHRRGDLALEDYSLKEANKFYQDALNELQFSPARESINERWLYEALNHSKLGKVALARDLVNEAEKHFDAAVSILENIPEKSINDRDDYKRTLATSYSEQAEVALKQQQLDKTASLCEKAFGLLKGLGVQDDYNQSLIAETLAARAAVACKVKQLAAAEKCIEEAKSIQEPLARSASADARMHFILARIYVEAAALYHKQGQHEAAAKYCKRAYEMSGTLHEGDKTRKPYALVLCESLAITETVALAQANDAKAKEARQELNNLVAKFVGNDPEDKRFQQFTLASRLPP